MAEESEKRFHAIMNKIFSNTPTKSKSTTSRSGAETLSGRKRRHSSRLGGDDFDELGRPMSVSATSAQASSCRPWDRDDLFRRLSTFKSMTWFAKPQVVSPSECARRGWINVDVDTIACESCGARLLFSTPSAWTQQQVEKAAMVFSLKLENGHKLLCPWINNVCTEDLAQFPVVTRAGLIEDYKKRFLTLSQLTALPVISHDSIGSSRSPQLENFLKESSTSDYDALVGKSRSENPVDITESSSSISYYQVQKLISLFGWEPHILPYIVDVKDVENQITKNANVTITTGEKQKVNLCSFSTNDGTKSSGELRFDPSSVVLDCKLCGASVGLWAFCTIPRPLEYLRFVGLTEVNGKNISTGDEGSEQRDASGSEIHNGKGITDTVTTASTSLGFTIAGGPPPAMLNYGASISLPVIGQSLRARLPVETENRVHSTVQGVSQAEGGGPATTNWSEPNRQETVDAGNSEKGSNQDISKVGPLAKYTPVPFSTREDKKLLSSCKTVEFDPIKQHRHFCPWIESNGKFSPGWQQTLSALEGQNELSFPLPDNVLSSGSIEVDDPLDSVRNLFASPDEKRRKIAGES